MNRQGSRGSTGKYQADVRAGVAALLASISLMSGQESRGSIGEYQADGTPQRSEVKFVVPFL